MPSRYSDITITNSLATTSTISFHDEASIGIVTPASWTTCTVTIYVRNPVDDVFYPLIDSAGNACTFTADPGKAYTLTDALFPWDAIRLVSDESANNSLVVGGCSKA
jgi:hypothetical protein